MYVDQATDIRPEVKAVLERNPFTARLQEITRQVTQLEREEAEHKTRIEQFKRDLVHRQTQASVAHQKLRMMANEKKVLEKVKNSDESKDACSFLNTADIQAFFEANKLLFVSLAIKQSGEAAKLQYIRPSKTISSMPVSPMVIEMYYEKVNGELALRNSYAYLMFTSKSGYSHPHISGTKICMGNYYDIMSEKKYSVCLDGYQEQVIMLESLLSTYNPDSPYQRIDDMMRTRIKYGEEYNSDIEIEVDNYATYTFRNSKLSVAQGAYSLKGIIPRSIAEEYYKKIDAIISVDLLDDLAASLEMEKFEDMNYDENHEFLSDTYNSISALVPSISFSDPDDHRYYNDDIEEYEGIDPDTAEDLCKEYAKKLRAFISSKDAIKTNFSITNKPDLNMLYGVSGQPSGVTFRFADSVATLDSIGF